MIHIYPVLADGTTQHFIEETACWCLPSIEWEDPDTGEVYSQALVIHYDEPELFEEHHCGLPNQDGHEDGTGSD
jgi:hypothetical protein